MGVDVKALVWWLAGNLCKAMEYCVMSWKSPVKFQKREEQKE